MLFTFVLTESPQSSYFRRLSAFRRLLDGRSELELRVGGLRQSVILCQVTGASESIA
jgi:hypothetical protein